VTPLPTERNDPNPGVNEKTIHCNSTSNRTLTKRTLSLQRQSFELAIPAQTGPIASGRFAFIRGRIRLPARQTRHHRRQSGPHRISGRNLHANRNSSFDGDYSLRERIWPCTTTGHELASGCGGEEGIALIKQMESPPVPRWREEAQSPATPYLYSGLQPHRRTPC
jgi:hypothetical protein